MYTEYDEDGYEIDEWNIDDYMDVLRDEEKEEKSFSREMAKHGKAIVNGLQKALEEGKNGKSI
jgi:hypothetical protein